MAGRVNDGRADWEGHGAAAAAKGNEVSVTIAAYAAHHSCQTLYSARISPCRWPSEPTWPNSAGAAHAIHSDPDLIGIDAERRVGVFHLRLHSTRTVRLLYHAPHLHVRRDGSARLGTSL